MINHYLGRSICTTGLGDCFQCSWLENDGALTFSAGETPVRARKQAVQMIKDYDKVKEATGQTTS
jgi:hypothetical protein